MGSKSSSNSAALLDNPLEGEELFVDAMLRRKVAPKPKQQPQAVQQSEAKPQHYKIVSISLYLEDIARLEEMVKDLKERGHHKANKSQLIRFALSKVNLDEFPREV